MKSLAKPGVTGIVGAALTGVAALLLAACTSFSERAESLLPGYLTSEVSEPGDPMAADVRRRGEEEMEAAEAEGTPSLAEVPARPVYDDAEVRGQITAGLLDDRQKARDTAEALAANRRVGAPVAATSQYTATERMRTSSTSTAVSASVSMPAQEAPDNGAAGDLPPESSRTELAGGPPAPEPPAPPAPPAVPAPAGNGSATVDTGVSAAPALPAVAVGPTLLATIYFVHGSTRLDARDIEIMRQIAEIRRRQGGRLLVIGHASGRTGQRDPARYQVVNRDISIKRADAVASALTRQGIAGSLIAIEGAGNSQPIYQESLPTGEAGNRRVEIYLAQ